MKLLEDRIVLAPDQRTGKEIEYVEYTLEENGVKKFYRTKLRGGDNKPSYLVQRLSEVREGEEVIMEMKKSGIKNFIEVTSVGEVSSGEIEDHDDEEIEEDKQQ